MPVTNPSKNQSEENAEVATGVMADFGDQSEARCCGGCRMCLSVFRKQGDADGMLLSGNLKVFWLRNVDNCHIAS